MASTVPTSDFLRDFVFSQSKLTNEVHRLEGRVEAIDQKLDLFLSFFINKDGLDFRMREKLKTRCSPHIKVHNNKDPEGADVKQQLILGPKITSQMQNVQRTKGEGLGSGSGASSGSNKTCTDGSMSTPDGM